MKIHPWTEVDLVNFSIHITRHKQFPEKGTEKHYYCGVYVVTLNGPALLRSHNQRIEVDYIPTNSRTAAGSARTCITDSLSSDDAYTIAEFSYEWKRSKNVSMEMVVAETDIIGIPLEGACHSRGGVIVPHLSYGVGQVLWCPSRSLCPEALFRRMLGSSSTLSFFLFQG